MNLKTEKNRIWRAAIYCRVSREDGDRSESESIVSQREMLRQYVFSQEDIIAVEEYIDDGISGASLNREGFQRMLSDLRSGTIDTVIVKELSRISRNYRDTGYLLDELFPSLGVRFISLNNGIDTAQIRLGQQAQLITVGMNGLINESYLAQASSNVKAALYAKMNKGEFIGARAPYGYRLSKEDRHKLELDPEAGAVVREIFDRWLRGESILQITRALNSKGLLNPSAYRLQQGLSANRIPQKSTWRDSTVRRILSHPVYAGWIRQHTQMTINYKTNRCIPVAKEEQIVVWGGHETVVSQEEFDRAQKRFETRSRIRPQKGESVWFSGLVRCADCQSPMASHYFNSKNRYLRCVYKRKVPNGCTNHTIRVDDFEEQVLFQLREKQAEARRMMAELKQINSLVFQKRESESLSEELKMLQEEKETSTKILSDLYSDWKRGDISKLEYHAFREIHFSKVEELEAAIERLNDMKQALKCGVDEQNAFVQAFVQADLKQLTREMAITLIEKIYVHENKTISIAFHYQDAYEKAKLYIKENQELLFAAS